MADNVATNIDLETRVDEHLNALRQTVDGLVKQLNEKNEMLEASETGLKLLKEIVERLTEEFNRNREELEQYKIAMNAKFSSTSMEESLNKSRKNFKDVERRSVQYYKELRKQKKDIQELEKENRELVQKNAELLMQIGTTNVSPILASQPSTSTSESR